MSTFYQKLYPHAWDFFLKQDLDLDLTILLFNNWNKMIPIHILHLSFEIIM